MAEHSAIEWTDATWNPIRGCTKVSPGCKHCYAETFAERFRGVKGHPFEQGFDLRLVPEKLREPMRWRKPRKVFVNSMSDLFHEDVPEEYVARVFEVMALTPRHTYQVLTKRAERMRNVVSRLAPSHTAPDGSGWPLPNVWLGVSVENQRFADERIPLLLETPAAVRFISAEPLLGPLTLTQFWNGTVSCDWLRCKTRLDWVIVGGESGAGARPFNIAWARSIVRQCQAAGVPVFVKQLGALPTQQCGQCGRTVGRVLSGFVDACGPTHAALITETVRIHSHKGGDPSEWPEDLRVRQFPTFATE